MSRTCAVCLRSFSTTFTGLLRTHGPVTARCPGSGKLPRPPAAVPTSPGSSSPPATESTSPASPSPPPSPVLAQIPRVRVLKRIPKSARHQCSSKLTTLLKDIVSSNSMEAWNRLFLFTPTCLRQPRRGKYSESLASLVKRQLQDVLAPSGPHHHLGGGRRLRSAPTLRSTWLGECLRRLRKEILEALFNWLVRTTA